MLDSITCCNSDNNSNIAELRTKTNKFNDIKEILFCDKVPFTCDQINLMFCSPVGNQKKFQDEIKADIALSGYCTAPDAAIAYIKDRKKDEGRECRHSFDTYNMKRGLIKLLKSIGFLDAEGIYDSSIDFNSYNLSPRFLFTQMLCMISHDESPQAILVERLLKEQRMERITEQASYSLTAWYRRIKACLKNKSPILLMGNNSINLLENSWVKDSCNIHIDFKNKYKYFTLKEQLELDGYKLLSVYHASALNRTNKEKDWNSSIQREKVHNCLFELFPNAVLDPNINTEKARKSQNKLYNALVAAGVNPEVIKKVLG